jgi:hypothetical protein
MATKNKYSKNAKISEAKIRQIVRFFSTEIVPDCSKSTLQGIIRGRVSLESVIHSDGWRGYDGLVDLGYQKHFRVEHGKNEFATEQSHINGIESF